MTENNPQKISRKNELKKTDLMLVVAPYQDIYGFVKEAKMSSSPLGLAYVAAYAEKKGYNTKLLDFDALNLKVEDIASKVREYSPLVVGITCTTPLMMKIKQMIEIVKSIDKDIIVVLGGPHVCALPYETLKKTKADIVVKGEGELTIVDLMEYAYKKRDIKKIDGIFYKNKNKIIHNKPRKLIKNLDSLPFPARHLLPIQKYIAPHHLDMSGARFCNLIATRGCPGRCTFCGQSIIFKNVVRKRDPVKVVNEIELMVKKYDSKVFFFEDSTFIFYTDLVEKICKEILRRKLKIKWGATARVNLTDEKLLRLMKKAGCSSLFYGVESGNQDILNKAKKGITLKQIRDSIRVTKKVGISINASFIVGLPGETKKSIRDTINFAIELDPDYVSFSLATPYPGTEFYDTALAEGYDFSDWKIFSNARYEDPIYIPQGLNKKDLKKLYSSAYRKFYLRPKFILRTIFKIRSLKEFYKNAKIALSLFKKNK
jgi:anaerobic magnesium-protoporphyrin IX monomethyl ester cyclase